MKTGLNDLFSNVEHRN